MERTVANLDDMACTLLLLAFAIVLFILTIPSLSLVAMKPFKALQRSGLKRKTWTSDYCLFERPAKYARTDHAD